MKQQHTTKADVTPHGTLLYYLVASSLLDAGGTDNDCLQLAWCLEQLLQEPVLAAELARTPAEHIDYRLRVLGVQVGNAAEHRTLLSRLTPEALLASDTYEQAVKLVLADALGPIGG